MAKRDGWNAILFSAVECFWIQINHWTACNSESDIIFLICWIESVALYLSDLLDESVDPVADLCLTDQIMYTIILFSAAELHWTAKYLPWNAARRCELVVWKAAKDGERCELVVARPWHTARRWQNVMVEMWLLLNSNKSLNCKILTLKRCLKMWTRGLKGC